MEEKLREFEGKRVDLNCGAGSMFRGVVKLVEEKTVTIIDEDDHNTTISVDKIIAVTECMEPLSRPGFIG